MLRGKGKRRYRRWRKGGRSVAIVPVTLTSGYAVSSDGSISTWQVTVPMDDADFIVDPVTEDVTIDGRARFQGDFVCVVTGPATIRFNLWRPNRTDEPWYVSDQWFPEGVSSEDTPIVVAPSGPFQRWGQFTLSSEAWT